MNGLGSIERVRELKEQIEQTSTESERAERDGDFAQAADLHYGWIPALEELDAAIATANEADEMLKEKVTRGRRRLLGQRADRHPGRPGCRGETAKASQVEGQVFGQAKTDRRGQPGPPRLG